LSATRPNGRIALLSLAVVSAASLVEVLELGGRVSGIEVDQPGLEHRRDHITVADLELVRDRIAVVSERLPVDLSQEHGLGGVDGPD
jgi:hypothetical protein